MKQNLLHQINIGAINSFGSGGSNAHIVLKSNNQQSKILEKRDLVIWSGRTREAVEHVLKQVSSSLDESSEIQRFNGKLSKWIIRMTGYESEVR